MREREAIRRCAILFSSALLLVAISASMLPVQIKVMLHLKGTLHPWLHVVLFGWLAAMSELVPRRLSTKITFLLSLTAFCAGVELTESVRFHTVIEYVDIWTDLVGILLGVSVALLVMPVRRV